MAEAAIDGLRLLFQNRCKSARERFFLPPAHFTRERNAYP